MQAMIAAAVAAALEQKTHQHTPIQLPELSGRTRAEGVLIVKPGEENAKFVEVEFNDGTVRRDYK